ncbi:hypothetical protein BJV78DRAFT_1223807 [Lactifluus subvellereus]|nr:hypothetical protein BJV78DRAFT_1223807 [Lactifluus subvellereus]
MVVLSLWHTKLLLLTLSSTFCSAQIPVTIPLTAPGNAQGVSRSLFSFSIEQDRWIDWIGQGPANPFFFNTLNNLKQIAHEPPRIRIGADSEDRTTFDPAVQAAQNNFPAFSANVPYPEATDNVVGNNFYQLASLLPPGTPVIWGVNFAKNDVPTAVQEATAIANAFMSPAFKKSSIMLEAVEMGNEADLYANNGLRDNTWNIQTYVTQWTAMAEAVTTAVNKILGVKVPLQGAGFATSSHNAGGFSPQGMFQNGILTSAAGEQIKLISQHHYSGTFCTGNLDVLQNLMSKANIRANLGPFAPDIAAVQQQGLTYILGETNSYACHGAPGVSNTAGAALWGLDYALFAAQMGVERLYFHQGIGYKYNFVQPIALTRSILDGTALAQPLPPHIQPLYYAAVIAAEAIGPLGITRVVELDVNNAQISGYAFFEGNSLSRAVFINLNAFMNGNRGFQHLTFNFAGVGTQPTSVIIKRLFLPTADATQGVTWGGQTYETQDGKVAGNLATLAVPVGNGVDIYDTEAILLTFG